MRALPVALAVAATGCFDFSKLSECNGDSAWACDNFERGTPADVWSVFSPDPTVVGTVDATKAHASTRALHIAATAQVGAEYQLQWKPVPPTAGLTAFVRAFVFLPAATTNTISLFAAIESSSPFAGVRVFVKPDGSLTLHNGVSGPDADSSMAMPVGRWTCIEWEIVEDNAPDGGMTLWIDDTQVAQTSGDTMPASKLGQIGIGVVYQATLMTNDSLELWIDDVIVDDQRITCRQ